MIKCACGRRPTAWEVSFVNEHQYRIQADDNFLHALGRAVFNFWFLETVVREIMARLGADRSFLHIEGASFGPLRDFFISFVKKSSLDSDLRESLIKWANDDLKACNEKRNDILHGYPHVIDFNRQGVARVKPRRQNDLVGCPEPNGST
jgi:hypothetical protein